MLSVLSPGNAVRAASYSDTPGVIETVFRAVACGAEQLFTQSSLSVAVCLGAAALLGWRQVQRARFSFRFPLLFSLMTFLLYCAQFAPPLYAMGSIGEGRLYNLYFFTLLWWWVFNFLYWLGWLTRKDFPWYRLEDGLACGRRILLAAFFCEAVFFLPAAQGAQDGASWDGSSLTGVAAAVEMISTKAQTYAEEIDARTKILRDTSVKKAAFSPLSVQPKLLFYAALTQDASYVWSNRPMAKYYGKESVVVLWDES